MKANRKRNLFEELKEGLQEIKEHQARKITLRTYAVQKQQRPIVNAALIREIRERFNMSRMVFAHKLRVSPRTLEKKWELGKTIPNDQAADSNGKKISRYIKAVGRNIILRSETSHWLEGLNAVQLVFCYLWSDDRFV